MSRFDGDVVVVRPSDEGFWPLVGPFVSSKVVHVALGSAPVVEDRDVWVVAMECGVAVGVAALRVGRRGAMMCHAFVVDEHRGHGVHGVLVDARESAGADFGVSAFHAVATNAARRTYENRGYQQTGTRGRYTLLRKDVKDVEDERVG